MAGNPPTSGSQQLWPPPPAASGSMNPQSFAPPYPMQRASGGPQGHQFVNHQFHPQGQPQGQPPPYSQQFLQRPVQPGHAAPSPYPQMSMPMTSGMPQHAAPNHGGAYSSSYTFAPSPYGLPQNGMSAQFQPPPQISSPFGPAGGQPWLHANQAATPAQQAFPTAATAPAVEGSPAAQQTASDWQEFDAADGRRYYYNKATKQSSWEKPAELMTPIERADASTVWKEFTTPEGRKYYYNKETKQSKWTIPDDLKAAREEAEKAAAEGNSGMKTISSVSTPVHGTSIEKPSDAVNTPGSTMSTLTGVTSSSLLVASIGSDANTPSEPAVVTPTHTAATTSDSMPSLGEKVTSSPSGVPVNSDFPVSLASVKLTPSISSENPSSQVVASPLGGASVQDIEEAKKGMAVAGKINDTPAEEKTVEDEPIVYGNKQDAKNAFKSLLESANVAADWTWDQAMRVIINDKRYGALKTLGERKQAFNEYMMQRKKLEAEERRLRQRKAKEEFMRMLEESEELTSSMRWSKALVMFEDDERFKAVEQEADREDLFRSYLVDLQKKEKAKAQEEYRRNRTEFRQFLEASSFIKVDTQWRKVQDLLEEDERCTRLDKIDRLDVFQDYIRDLEKEEDEQKKRQKEQLRRAERKNRDAFRKMMEEHIAAGVLTAKTFWRDYCQKVKDSEAYEAVASNTSGSTPKDLFEDVVEELEKKYNEDKARVKDALKQEKVTVSATWTFEDFKTYTQESIGSLAISDFTLQLVYEDLIDRAKEREEKEAKKRKRLAKDFTDKLSTIKDIDVSSSWEECKPLVDDSFEYRSMGDDSLCMEIFNEYISRLQEKAKEKERKREEEKAKKEKEREDKEKKKDKERKEKEREKEKDKVKEHSRKDEVESDDMDVEESHIQKDDKRREKDKERKHRKRHQSTNNDVSSDKDDKEESRKSHRHGSDRKKSRKHAYSPESESESRHKKHKRDQKDGSRRSGGNEELEDGELGEDGEIQ